MYRDKARLRCNGSLWSFHTVYLIARYVASARETLQRGLHHSAEWWNKSRRRPWASGGISKPCLSIATNAALCIAAVISASNCKAQQLPFIAEPHTTSLQPYEKDALVTTERTDSYSSSIAVHPPAAIYSMVRPAPNPRIANSKFLVVNFLNLGMAVVDVELTQRCIASHQCREGNPLMPSSQAGQLSIGIGYAALGSLASYWLRKHKSPRWWIPPAVGMAGHAAGIATGIRN